MTDKPASSKNSNNAQSNKKANTINKSTDKSANSSANSPAKAPITPPASTQKAEPKKDSQKPVSEPVKNTASKPADKAPLEKNQKPVKKESSSKISKLAVLSLLIALLAVVGVVLLYFWHMQQQEALESRLQESATRLEESANKTIIQLQDTMKDVFNDQKEALALQVESSVNNMEENTTDRITQLNEMVEKFSQNQPTDWLVHEAEYLVRVAARTLWLEKDATAAVGLLLDANDRITELNNPEVLPVRQLIHQDIAAIKALPTLETEEVILSLIALGEQVQNLPLVTLSVAQEEALNNDFELSEDVSQWRENIQKTWNRFLDTFVVVHSRMGDLEPILPADQRANLKENLSLKLQIAQWAASKGKDALFIKSLNDVQAWLEQYFEMEDARSTSFNETINSLKSKKINVDVSNKLVSLQAIRNILSDRESTRKSSPVIEELQEPVEEDLSEDSLLDETQQLDQLEPDALNNDLIESNKDVIDDAENTIDNAEGDTKNIIDNVEENIENTINNVEDDAQKAVDEADSSITELKDKTIELKEDA